MVSSMIEGLVCVWQGVDQQFWVYCLFILNFQTLNCLQFKPKLFSLNGKEDQSGMPLFLLL